MIYVLKNVLFIKQNDTVIPDKRQRKNKKSENERCLICLLFLAVVFVKLPAESDYA